LQQLSTAWFQQILERLPRAGRFWIALSGGLDSRVLLELCARLKASNPDYHFHAIHVNHQLQSDAAQWAQFCTLTCAELGFDCVVETVNAQPVKGKSPEQAARDARRAVFNQLISDNDVLLTAHHLNDQAETVLLRLFRGSGITGLAGIRPYVEFSDGWIARPLLEVSREQLQLFAEQHSLQWVEDPSNQLLDYDRNYLRQKIIPQLEQRWPGLQNTLARNAHICLESDNTLREVAKQTLTQIVIADNTLSIPALLALDDTMQNLVLREWFAKHQLTMPSFKMLQRIKQEVIRARADRVPSVKWQNEGKQYQIRRYRHQLFLLPPQQSFDTTTSIQWDGLISLRLPANLGNLRVVQSLTGGIAEKSWKQSEITIRFRSGGEMCQLPGRKGHRSLKAIFQEAGIPPWQRDRIPLVYLDNQLAAVGALLICEPFYVDPQQTAIIIEHY
jgi:tRNA(Ile)-lysidine synthase